MKKTSGFSQLSFVLSSLIFIYLILAVSSICFLLSSGKSIHIPFKYERLFSIGYGYWLAASFIIVLIGLGIKLFRLPLFEDLKLTGLNRILFAFGGGFYIFYCILMAMALLNLLYYPVILFLLLIAVPSFFSGYSTVKEFLFSYRRQAFKSRRKIRINKKVIIIGVLMLIWIMPYFIQSLLPNTDWDGACYHLPLAKRFIDGKINSVDFYCSHYDFPGAVHLVYAFFLNIKGETAVIPFNLLSSLLIVLAVYSSTLKLWNRRAAIWAALICIAVNLLWEVALTPRIDSFLSLFFLLSVVSFLFWLQDKNSASLLIMTGLMLGISLGIKYTAWFLFIIIALMVIYFCIKSYGKNRKGIITVFLVFVIVCAFPSGFWYIRNFISIGNPVYPLISGRLAFSPEGKKVSIDSYFENLQNQVPSEEDVKTELEYIYGTKALLTKHVEINRPKNIFNFLDIIRNPDKYQRNPLHEINILLLAFFLLPIFSRKRSILVLYGISVSLYIFIGFQAWLIRYALPVFFLFALGAGIVLSHVRSKTLIIALSALLSLNIIYFNYFEWGEASTMRPKEYLIQGKDRIEWLTEVGYNLRLIDTPRFIKHTNKMIDMGLISKNETIFMVGECKGNLLKCDYLPDTGSLPYRWLGKLINHNFQHEKIMQEFNNNNIGYIAFNKAFFKEMMIRYTNQHKPIIIGLYHLSHFLKKYSKIVYDKHGIILAEIERGDT